MKYMLPIAVLLLAGCKKEDCECPKPAACEADNYGWVKFTNPFADPYECYIDDVWKCQLAPGGTSDPYGVGAGADHELKQVQTSGWVVFPSVYTQSQDVWECQTYTW